MGRSYLQALAAAKKAMKQCEAAGEPCQRPADYYAEMMKSDTQMKKVPSLCD
jgi:rRNA-processing protein EBP2